MTDEQPAEKKLSKRIFSRRGRALLELALSSRRKLWPWLALFSISCALAFRQWLIPAEPSLLVVAAAIGTHLALPLMAAYLSWADVRSLIRGDSLQQLIVTLVPRTTILRSALRKSLVFPSLATILVLPLMVTHRVPSAYGVAWLRYYGRDLMFRVWFAEFFGAETEGHLMIAVVTLVALHAAMRFGGAVGARTAVGGRASLGALARGLAFTMLPVLVSLVFAHCITAYLFWLENMYVVNPHWLDRLTEGKWLPLSYHLAAFSCLSVLPLAIVALFCRPLLRSTARRLDSLVND